MGDAPARSATGKRMALIDIESYEDLAHSEVACTVCHPQSAQYRHALQQPGDCLRCHQRHHDKVAHDAHLTVACGACHLKGGTPVRDPETRRVGWAPDRRPGGVLEVHDMALGGGEASCLRCHTGGNEVGAAAMVLPPKGIICMPCHAATFSAGDATTIVSLLVFLLGGGLLASYWMTGNVPGVESGTLYAKLGGLAAGAVRAVFSADVFPIAKAMFLDVLLQRRLFRRSRGRWLIHSLIFYPFVFRFLWGMTTLCATLWAPGWGPAWAMIDKNHPLTGVLFDITGIMVIMGIVLAFARGAMSDRGTSESMPARDHAAFLLIGTVVVVGFFLEGVRIAMTAWPAGAGWAFVGYVISLPVSYLPSLTSIYGVLWYVHAILTGAFVAYLPFSRLLHVIMAPLTLALNAVSEREHGKGSLHGR
jgi:nitrate reductase gamma subunit